MRHMLPFRIPTAARSWFAHTPLALSLCVVGFGVAPAPAEAQARALEEVVVTARKREESLQDTPIAITAFSGDQLREAGISNLADFNKTIPNMEVQAGNGNAGVANIYIRGVGQRNTEPNLDSGVGIYLDGVYISRADGALLDVNDLQSVQVLRGPQGTLFGKNTTGGALVFTTNRPGPEFESSVLVRGGNYKRRDAEAMINIPLIDDTLYTRLSMVAKKRDGYVHNLFDGQDYNDEDRLSAVWQLRWLPHDDVVVDFNTNYGKTAQQAHLQKCIEVPEAAATAWQDRTTNVYVRRANNNKSIIDFCRESQALDTYTVDSTGGQYNAENRGFSTTIDWAFADNISLKSVTGWRGTRAGQDDPLDAISIPLLTRSNYAHPFADERDTDQYSQEFQLVGDAFENRLRWVGGLYGFRETTDSTTINKVGPFQFIDAIPGFPAEPNRYFYNTTASTLDVDNKAWSAFVQADWSMTEQWVLTLGARFTKETRELGLKVYEPDRSTLALNGVVTNNVQQAIWIFSQPNDFNPNHGFVLDRRSKESVNSSAWTPLVSLQYLIPQSGWVDNGTVYVTYSEGFRSGGLSESPLGDLDQFEPEKVKNYELGVKADLFDRRVRLNLSGFYMDYTNRQLTTVAFDTINFQPAGATINAKDSNISGIELESQFMVLPDLEVGFNATWSRGRIKEYTDTQISWLTLEEKIANWLPTPPPGCVQNFIVLPSNEISICEIDRSDENLPRLPKRSFMLSAQYFLQTDFGTIIPRVQGSWKFDIENCFDRRSCESGIWFSDKQFNLDARVTWLSQDSQWMFAVFGSNLTEEDYAIGGTPLVDALGFGGQSYAVPKMYGAELQYKY